MEVEIRVGSEFLIQFKRLSKKYRSLKSDIKDLKDSLVINPFQGTSLGKGVRKVRMVVQGSSLIIFIRKEIPLSLIC